MVAREAARRDSSARITGKSVFIKRYHGEYRIIGVNVTKEQRKCRDIFADAQKLASYELKQWNKKRHWVREAKRHKVKGAHRMAVSHYYKILKENGLKLDEVLKGMREKKFQKEERVEQSGRNAVFLRWENKENDRSPFYYKKFGDVEEYHAAIQRIAA